MEKPTNGGSKSQIWQISPTSNWSSFALKTIAPPEMKFFRRFIPYIKAGINEQLKSCRRLDLCYNQKALSDISLSTLLWEDLALTIGDTIPADMENFYDQLPSTRHAGGQGQKGIRASLLLGAFCGNGGLEVGRKNEL